MKQANKMVKVVFEFIKKVWPSLKILIKTLAPII